MKFLLDFLNQKAPRSGSEMPAYYRNALSISRKILCGYFLASVGMFLWATGNWLIVPMVMFAATLVCLLCTDKIPTRTNLIIYAVVTLFWCAWFIHTFGWSCGGQHLLLPLLILAFFNIYDPPWLKAVYFMALLIFRMCLYAYSLQNTAVYAINMSQSVLIQSVNSVTLFIIMACLCILFSTNLQDTERQLRINNQELHREAGTDPLTQLPNRRAMLEEMERFCKSSPDMPFAVAIADIDFFKRVNDTYGHNCGDYTLKQLADKFRETAGTEYSVCRWGGEEFCFFMPGKNVDEAGSKMIDLNVAVSRMPLSFEGNDFSITITIGVEENDFRSPMEAILDRADRKLYMGKSHGRNQVVV